MSQASDKSQVSMWKNTSISFQQKYLNWGGGAFRMSTAGLNLQSGFLQIFLDKILPSEKISQLPIFCFIYLF